MWRWRAGVERHRFSSYCVALFLRPQRQPDGQRTFRLIEGESLPTSYGEDSYARIFGPASGPTFGVNEQQA